MQIRIYANLGRIGGDTGFGMVNRNSAWSTLEGLRNGEMEWPDPGGGDTTGRRNSGKNRGIDADTDVAIYVGLADNANGQPVEAIIDDVVVERA